MPTYLNVCMSCSFEFREWASIHDTQGPVCPECGAPTVHGITTVQTYGIGDRGAKTRHADKMDRQIERDRPAYARLRREGHQPQAVLGAEKLEATATNDWEIKTGGLVSVPEERKDEVNEMLANGAATSWSPVEEVHKKRGI